MRTKTQRITFRIVLAVFVVGLGFSSAWGTTHHVVQPGENLWVIARRYQVPLQDLLRMNGLSEKSILQPGMKIVVKKEASSIGAGCEYYEVKKGDTLWNIARKHNISVQTLMEANGLNENSILQIGQKLLLPGTSTTPIARSETASTTVTHTVKQGESLWLISRFYGVSIKSIMEANGLNEQSILQVGMKLAIPGIAVSKVTSNDRRVAVAPPEQYEMYRVQPGDTLWAISRRFRISVEALTKANGLTEKSVLRVGQTLKIPSSVPRQYVQTETQGNLLWPVRGRISSPFGPRGRGFHSGIDIIAPSGTLIRAAQSGVVSFSGTMRGYGRVVIIDHPGGWQTVYAHNSVNLVTRGQRVNQGEPIAKVGRTGNATTTHLHFEVRRGGRCVDPLQFLRK